MFDLDIILFGITLLVTDNLGQLLRQLEELRYTLRKVIIAFGVEYKHLILEINLDIQKFGLLGLNDNF